MASRSVNKVILLGHLGRDAETKFTPGGAAVTRFSVATTNRRLERFAVRGVERRNGLDEHRPVAFRESDHLPHQKASRSTSRAASQTRSYDDKDGKKVYATEVVADDVILLGSQGGSGGSGGGPGRGTRRILAGAGIGSERRRYAPEASTAGSSRRLRPGHHRRRRAVFKENPAYSRSRAVWISERVCASPIRLHAVSPRS